MALTPVKPGMASGATAGRDGSNESKNTERSGGDGNGDGNDDCPGAEHTSCGDGSRDNKSCPLYTIRESKRNRVPTTAATKTRVVAAAIGAAADWERFQS